MFNKIKNFFNRVGKAIDNKCNEIYCKSQTAVANAKAEFYIDKTVGIIIAGDLRFRVFVPFIFAVREIPDAVLFLF